MEKLWYKYDESGQLVDILTQKDESIDTLTDIRPPETFYQPFFQDGKWHESEHKLAYWQVEGHKIKGITFTETPYFFGKVGVHETEKSLYKDFKNLHLIWKDDHVEEAQADEIELLKAQIKSLTEAVDFKDDLIQELGLIVYA